MASSTRRAGARTAATTASRCFGRLRALSDIGGGAAGAYERIPDACDVGAAALLAGAVGGFSGHRAFYREYFATVLAAVVILSHVFCPSSIQVSI